MKNLFTVLIVFAIAISSRSAAHNGGISGTAIYSSQREFNFQMDDQDIPPAEKAKIKASLKNALKKDFELKFNAYESSYKEIEKLDGGPAYSSGGMQISVSTSGGVLYKNLKDKAYLEENSIMGKEFLVSGIMEAKKWKLSGETKTIGKYECKKASYMNAVTIMEMTEENGEMEVKEKIDSSEVVVWYSPEIAVGHGPEELFGLPGLILEIEAKDFHLLCKKVTLNSGAELAIEKPKTGKKINQEDFDALREKKMQEMQDRYKGQDGHEKVIIMSGN